MRYDNPNETYIIALIYEKHPYLVPLASARTPVNMRGVIIPLVLAVLPVADFNSRDHVPVFDDELRRFVRQWLVESASMRTCCQDEDAILCLVPAQ